LTNTEVYIMHAVIRHTSVFRASVARPLLSPVSRTSIVTARSIGNYHRRSTFDRSFVKKQVANMSSESTQSQACCSTPAVVSKGYKPKGDYIEVDGLKTCKFTSPITHTSLTCNSRRHRSQRRKARYPRRLRYLWLLQSDHPRRRHPRLHR
jgi:hypothetical protein